MSTAQKTIAYILLIVIGWGIGEYPHIPSFQFDFISCYPLQFSFRHIQPSIQVVDKCVAITLLAFSLGLFFALWHNFWVRVVMIFITWGMFSNAVDELKNKAEIFDTIEQISLLFALTTTAYLIWKRHRKLATK